jgi:hypothetical protein
MWVSDMIISAIASSPSVSEFTSFENRPWWFAFHLNGCSLLAVMLSALRITTELHAGIVD